MPRSRILFLIVVVGLALISSFCSKEPARLEIKGLYLNMDLAEACSRLESVYRQVEGDSFRPLQWIQISSFAVHTNRALDDDVTIGNSDSGVRYFIFNRGLVEKMFACPAQSAEEFARSFAKAQGLAGLKPGSNTVEGRIEPYWEYVSSKGWKVVVLHDKTLVLKYWRSEENEKW